MSHSVSLDDLQGLWRVGAVTMPNIAVKFAEAAKALHSANYGDDAFSTCEGLSPLYEPYTKLLETFQDRVLVKSSDNCVAAGAVLCKIADSFATTDHLNATQIARYDDFQDQIERGRIAGWTVPEAPYAPDSDDQHPEEYQR